MLHTTLNSARVYCWLHSLRYAPPQGRALSPIREAAAHCACASENLHHVVALNACPGLFGGAARGATWQHQDVHGHAGGGRHAGGLQGWRKAENGILSAPCPLQAGDPGYKRVIWA